MRNLIIKRKKQFTGCAVPINILVGQSVSVSLRSGDCERIVIDNKITMVQIFQQYQFPLQVAIPEGDRDVVLEVSFAFLGQGIVYEIR